MTKEGKYKTKWKDEYYVVAYQLASQGMPNREIAEVLGTSEVTFRAWRIRHPVLKFALQEGRNKCAEASGEDEEHSYRAYIFQRLPENLKKLWRKINKLDEEKSGIKQIELMLEKEGKYARMHLFLYALSASNFNVSRALKRVNVTLIEFKRWLSDEAGFAEMIQEMKFHKKNFFDECLVKRAKAGDTAAIIFANKTLNQDQYMDKQIIEHTGSIKHEHMIDIDSLNLPIEIRKAILEAHRKNLNEQKDPRYLEYKRNGNSLVPIEEK